MAKSAQGPAKIGKFLRGSPKYKKALAAKKRKKSSAKRAGGKRRGKAKAQAQKSYSDAGWSFTSKKFPCLSCGRVASVQKNSELCAACFRRHGLRGYRR